MTIANICFVGIILRFFTQSLFWSLPMVRYAQQPPCHPPLSRDCGRNARALSLKWKEARRPPLGACIPFFLQQALDAICLLHTLLHTLLYTQLYSLLYALLHITLLCTVLHTLL